MRNPSRVSAVALAVAVLAALPGAVRAQALCPVDTLWAQSKLQVFGAVATRAASVDTAFINGCGRAVAQYDLALGSFASEIDFTCSGWTTTTAWDEFTLVGPGAGTPVSFRAELDADAQMISVPGSYPNLTANARLSSGDAAAVMSATTLPRQEVLSLPLTQEAEAPFAMRIALGTSTNVSGGHVRIAASLRFADLPAGTRVESCQGFQQVPVAARRSTWGALKSEYR